MKHRALEVFYAIEDLWSLSYLCVGGMVLEFELRAFCLLGKLSTTSVFLFLSLIFR
jgi:hypothetical protein